MKMPLNDPKPIKTVLNGINCIAFIYLIFGFSIIYPDYIEQINITISIIFLMMILFKLTIQNISKKFLNIIQKIPKEIPKFIWGVQIQSTKSTWFAILFTSLCAFILSLICQEFFAKYRR